jgi:hypothetical protein
MALACIWSGLKNGLQTNRVLTVGYRNTAAARRAHPPYRRPGEWPGLRSIARSQPGLAQRGRAELTQAAVADENPAPANRFFDPEQRHCDKSEAPLGLREAAPSVFRRVLQAAPRSAVFPLGSLKFGRCE